MLAGHIQAGGGLARRRAPGSAGILIAVHNAVLRCAVNQENHLAKSMIYLCIAIRRNVVFLYAFACFGADF
jgi:hypothetical protein